LGGPDDASSLDQEGVREISRRDTGVLGELHNIYILLFTDSQMIDMCRTSTTYTDQHGAYLVTPDFPFSYSTGRHCSCTLQTVAGAEKLALEFVHVRLRQHDPALCHDWIDIQV